MGFSKPMFRCESHPFHATLPVAGEGYTGFM